MIVDAYQPGIQALKKNERANLCNAQIATGSIELDEAVRHLFPNEHRWDYGIGVSSEGVGGEIVVWLEVHHAASGETQRVIDKLRWLKGWLSEHAPRLRSMPSVFIWQLSNSERNPNDRRKRNQLAEQHGLRRCLGRLDLGQIAETSSR